MKTVRRHVSLVMKCVDGSEQYSVIDALEYL
jgi:hypothetical protein